MTTGTSITTRDPDRDFATLHHIPEPIQDRRVKKKMAKQSSSFHHGNPIESQFNTS
jgi:hypothetical protein